MAVWQWDIWMVPKCKVLKYFSEIPQYVTLDWFESIEWWDTVSDKQLKDFFNKILPRNVDLKNCETTSWGDDDKTCIKLMIEDEKITDVFIRIDVRQTNNLFYDHLINFAEENEFLFFSLESNEFIKAELTIFLEAFYRSRAMMFIKEPKRFFENQNYFGKINRENLRKIDKN